MADGLTGGVLVGLESSVGREARLRLFCPMLGTADALDGDTDDIVDDGDYKTIGGNVNDIRLK